MSEPVMVVAPAPAPARPELSWAERLADFGDWLSDRVNPLVVKEVRQGLRTRIFWTTFTLLLTGCVIISLVAYADAQDSGMRGVSSGRDFFYYFFICLGLIQFLVLPYTAYRSLVREREDETWVLLSLTGLGPRRILRGKLVSSLVQGLVYGSAIGPFLLMSYYLNGIDLPTILLVIGLGILLQMSVTLIAVSAGTLAEGRIFRAVINVAVLGGLLFATSSGLGFASFLSKDAHELIRDSGFYIGLGLFLWASVSGGLFLFEVAVARLSLLTENYTKGPRLALLFQFVGTTVIWGVAWLTDGRDAEIPVAMQIGTCLYLAFVGGFMASDVDGQSKGHRTVRGWRRALTPGAFRGFRFIALMLLLSTVVTSAALLLSVKHVSGTGDDTRLIAGILAAPAFVLLYLALPLIIGRMFQTPRLGSPTSVRLLGLAIVIAATGLPPLAGEVLYNKPTTLWLNVFNPFVGMANLMDRDTTSVERTLLLLVLVAGFGSALLADNVLARRDREVARGG
ncbi:MAG TPA: ABC transporter permease [Myxococcaceae bacterium]|nr:ABC transporter permease [Myxococcaceae bacterium]